MADGADNSLQGDRAALSARKRSSSGRAHVGIHFMQHWLDLSDPGMEDALYDLPCLRQFARIDLGRETAPDETTICKFRHILEGAGLGERLFHLVNDYLTENRLFVSKGTIVDATLIEAPTSTKNKAKRRDPDMHSTRKGRQWYFGMKAHVGVDSQSKLIHSVAVTPANTHDLRYWKSCCMEEKPGCLGQKKALSVRRRPETIPARRGQDTASYRMRKGRGIGTSQKCGAKWSMYFL